MKLTTLSRAAALATMIATGMTAAAMAQTPAADPHHPGTTVAQAMPPSGMMGQGQGAQAGQSTTPPAQSGAMGGMMQPGMMGQGMMGMHGPMMKIMFAVADTNGDGALSFDEVTAIHKRIFDRIDANRDGKVTPEEIQAFFRE